MQTVGFVGVGKIGLPISENLIKSGYRVLGYRRGSLADFEKAGGIPAKSPAEIGAQTDIEGAIPWLEMLAADNNITAHETLGTLALQGKAMTQNYAKAARHFEVAMRQGSESATFVLGQLHIKGLGMAKDNETGLRLITQSANAGNYQAMTMLASLLANGEDAPQDSQQAYKWITIVLNRAPQGDLFYGASGIETQLRSRLSNRQIEAAQAEASRFVVTPLKAANQ